MEVEVLTLSWSSLIHTKEQENKLKLNRPTSRLFNSNN